MTPDEEVLKAKISINGLTKKDLRLLSVGTNSEIIERVFSPVLQLKKNFVFIFNNNQVLLSTNHPSFQKKLTAKIKIKFNQISAEKNLAAMKNAYTLARDSQSLISVEEVIRKKTIRHHFLPVFYQNDLVLMIYILTKQDKSVSSLPNRQNQSSDLKVVHESALMEWETTFNSIGDSICILDPDLRIVRCNTLGHAVFGKIQTEVVRKHYWEVLYKSDKPIDGCPILLAKETLSPQLKEIEIGEKLYEASATPISGDSKQFNGLILILKDITAHRQIETLFRQNQEKLGDMIATKDKFFSIIAHDLRSPFHTLLNISQIIVDEFEQNTSSDLYKMNSILNSELKQVYSLVENLLVWGKSQRGLLEFIPVHQDITETIIHAITMERIHAQGKNISIEYDLPVDCMIQYDETMISSVLRNLLSNAIKFSHENSIIKVNLISNNTGIHIGITDQGVGMSTQEIDRLFKIDTHFSSRGTNNEKGSGLGLLLCNEFLNLHGGDITITSEINQGTTFTVNLPNRELPVKNT